MDARAALISLAAFIATLCNGQPIRNLRFGDTLAVQMDYIACIYGLDARLHFGLVHENDDYKVQYPDDSVWVVLSNEQEEGLLRFERTYLKSDCYSTSYVKVDLASASDTMQFKVCWPVGDDLIEVLKRR